MTRRADDQGRPCDAVPAAASAFAGRASRRPLRDFVIQAWLLARRRHSLANAAGRPLSAS